ncbi:hypothetical protein QBC43DRAFT_323207 [Cladorrhinum sp. PSN259]|nr:hypothetical protein QBC43DRAFT_323207 [Cladorrhinum sp. PSN259]
MSSSTVPQTPSNAIPIPALAQLATAQSHRLLTTLRHILTKAATTKPDDAPSYPAEARIHPDMQPLHFQAQIVQSFARALITPTKPGENKWAGFHEADATQSLEELISDVEKVLKETEEAKAEDVQKVVEGPHIVKPGEKGPAFNFSSEGFVFDFVLSNMYFHLCTAYAILRSKGVDLGKLDYLLPFVGGYMDQPYAGKK